MLRVHTLCWLTAVQHKAIGRATGIVLLPAPKTPGTPSSPHHSHSAGAGSRVVRGTGCPVQDPTYSSAPTLIFLGGSQAQVELRAVGQAGTPEKQQCPSGEPRLTQMHLLVNVAHKQQI